MHPHFDVLCCEDSWSRAIVAAGRAQNAGKLGLSLWTVGSIKAVVLDVGCRQWWAHSCSETSYTHTSTPQDLSSAWWVQSATPPTPPSRFAPPLHPSELLPQLAVYSTSTHVAGCTKPQWHRLQGRLTPGRAHLTTASVCAAVVATLCIA